MDSKNVREPGPLKVDSDVDGVGGDLERHRKPTTVSPPSWQVCGLGVVPYTLAVLAAQLQRMELAYDWLGKAYATPEGEEFKMLSLEEKELDGFWRKIVAI